MENNCSVIFRYRGATAIVKRNNPEGSEPDICKELIGVFTAYAKAGKVPLEDAEKFIEFFRKNPSKERLSHF